MILLVLSIVCAVLALLLAVKIHKTATYWKKAGIPHESFVEYLHYLFFRYSREDIFNVLEEYTERYGPVYGTYQGLNPVLRVTSPDGIKDALSRNFSKIHRRSIEAVTGAPLWDNSILVVDYPRWKKMRPLTGHVLTASKLKLAKSKIERVSQRLVSKFNKLAKTHSEIRSADYARGVLMDVMAAVTFSLEVDALEDPNHVFIKHCTGLFDNGLALTLLLALPGIFRFIPFVKFFSDELAGFFTGFMKTLLTQRRQPGHAASRSEPDVLDIWLETQKDNADITDEVLMAQMLVFFIAGYETSSYTLMMIMQLLATHPHKQEDVYRDIMENISDPDNITFEEYGKMKLLEASIYETLRLYPTDYNIDRITVAPCVVAGVSLDEGINVQIPMAPVHRDPERFFEPLQFRPERFLDEPNLFQHMLAFGEGPKNCVGQRMAILQLMVVLVAILRAVRLDPVADLYDPSREYQPVIERQPGQLFLPFPKQTPRVKLAPRN